MNLPTGNSTFGNGGIKPLIIRQAQVYDVEQVLTINYAWQKQNLKQIEDGFLSAAFDYANMLEVVGNKEIVVAEVEKKIVGYYLINNYSTSGILSIHRNSVMRLLETGKIRPSTSRIGIGVQAAIEKSYQGKGISRHMLNSLLEILNLKYDWLYSTVSKSNYKAIQIDLKVGWTIVDEDDSVYHVIYPVLQLNNIE